MKLGVVLAVVISSAALSQVQPAASPESQTVTIVGAVRQPGTYAFKEQVTLLRLITKAGGPTKDAKLNKVQIVRLRKTSEADNSRERQTINVDLSAIVKKTNPDMNLEAGDTVYVEPSQRPGGSGDIKTDFFKLPNA